jgi:methylmalonyl-CoA/ethylmalonyl-CoA epimerase
MKKSASGLAISIVLFIVLSIVNATSSVAESNSAGFQISHHHVGISVPNMEESIAWYRKMLGFEEVTRIKQGNEMVVGHIKRGNCYIELFQVAGAKSLPEYRRDPSADLRVLGTVHMAFQVADVQAAVKELRAKGAEIAMEPVDSPGVVFAFIRDNAGNCFELIQYKKSK